MHCAFREIERHLNTDIYNALHPNLLILYNMFINNTSDTQEVQVETNVSSNCQNNSRICIRYFRATNARSVKENNGG